MSPIRSMIFHHIRCLNSLNDFESSFYDSSNYKSYCLVTFTFLFIAVSASSAQVVVLVEVDGLETLFIQAGYRPLIIAQM